MPTAITVLREACEELAALYRAPLPADDDGLVAAVQRWRDLRPLGQFGRRGFFVTIETEEAIINPIAQAAEHRLEAFIEGTPAQGLRGVAAKLRYQAEQTELGLTLVVVDLEQLAELVERSADQAHRQAGRE